MSGPTTPEQAQAEPQHDASASEVSEDDARMARQIINTLTTKGIKVLALDFDKTIVAVHTHGYWRQGTPKLVEQVRPCFRALMQAAIEKKMHVCVVTYSMQPVLIRDVLKFVLPKGEAQKVLIRANSKDWLPSQGLDSSSYGKQQHIAWIVTELFNTKHAIIRPEEILLMDDDSDNVTLAENFGHQAYEVPEDVTMKSIQSFVELMEVKVSSPDH